MHNLYELLGISPYANRQEIETALQQQQCLGNVSTEMLTLAATTLLSSSERQNHDQQLMAMALADFQAPENTSLLTQQNQAFARIRRNAAKTLIFIDPLFTCLL